MDVQTGLLFATCEYVCMLAIKLDMHRARPPSFQCNLCGEVRDSNQALCAGDSKSDVNDCLKMAAVNKFYCIVRHQQIDRGMHTHTHTHTHTQYL
jgi:hypothetical protein